MNEVVKVFENHKVRIIERYGEPWFVAKDICEVLEIRNNRAAISSLAEDEKDDVAITDTIGRNQETTIISEPGLYRLIFKSRKKEAESFKRWVCHDVLPSIRKTGAYNSDISHLEAKIDALMSLISKEPEKIKTTVSSGYPSAEEVNEFCSERHLPEIGYEFCAWYETTDWHAGNGEKITNWQKCAMAWIKRNYSPTAKNRYRRARQPRQPYVTVSVVDKKTLNMDGESRIYGNNDMSVQSSSISKPYNAIY